MKYTEYSHRHGKELLQVLHPDILHEIQRILDGSLVVRMVPPTSRGMV